MSLASHSNGALYILNTLLYQRDLLDPERPYIALFGTVLIPALPQVPKLTSLPAQAPWVLPSHSGKHHLTLLQSLPSPILGTWHHIARFVNTSIAPFRSQKPKPPTTPRGPITQTIDLVPSSSKSLSPNTTNEDTTLSERVYQSILQTLLTKYVFLESIDGASQEVLICLQKGTNLWGEWKDYDDLVPQIQAHETQFRSPPAREEGKATTKRLRLQCFFASDDELVGTKGQKWFENVWISSLLPRRDDREGGEGQGEQREEAEEREWIDFRSEVIPKSNHNNLLPVEMGGIADVLKYISRVPG